MNSLGRLASSTVFTSSLLTIAPVTDKDKEMAIAFLSSLIVQIGIKGYEYWQKKKRIRRIRKPIL